MSVTKALRNAVTGNGPSVLTVSSRTGPETSRPPGSGTLTLNDANPLLQLIKNVAEQPDVRAGTQPRSPDGALNWPDGCGIYQRPLYRCCTPIVRGVPARCVPRPGRLAHARLRLRGWWQAVA